MTRGLIRCFALACDTNLTVLNMTASERHGTGEITSHAKFGTPDQQCRLSPCAGGNVKWQRRILGYTGRESGLRDKVPHRRLQIAARRAITIARAGTLSPTDAYVVAVAVAVVVVVVVALAPLSHQAMAPHVQLHP